MRLPPTLFSPRATSFTRLATERISGTLNRISSLLSFWLSGITAARCDTPCDSRWFSSSLNSSFFRFWSVPLRSSAAVVITSTAISSSAAPGCSPITFWKHAAALFACFHTATASASFGFVTENSAILGISSGSFSSFFSSTSPEIT